MHLNHAHQQPIACAKFCILIAHLLLISFQVPQRAALPTPLVILSVQTQGYAELIRGSSELVRQNVVINQKGEGRLRSSG